MTENFANFVQVTCDHIPLSKPLWQKTFIFSYKDFNWDKAICLSVEKQMKFLLKYNEKQKIRLYPIGNECLPFTGVDNEKDMKGEGTRIVIE